MTQRGKIIAKIISTPDGALGNLQRAIVKQNIYPASPTIPMITKKILRGVCCEFILLLFMIFIPIPVYGSKELKITIGH